MQGERSQIQRVYILYDSRKCKLIYYARKQFSGCLRRWEGLQRNYEGAWGDFGGDGLCPFSWLWWWFHRCTHVSILIKLYTLNIGSLLHVNYTSIKIFLSKRCIEDKKKSGCLPRNSTPHILYLGQLCESPRPRVTHCPVVRPLTSFWKPYRLPALSDCWSAPSLTGQSLLPS